MQRQASRGWRARFPIAVAGCALAASPALADGLLPARTDVAGARAQSAWDPAPVVVEPFTLTLGLRDTLAYDSNVYGDAGSGTGDGIAVIAPGAKLAGALGRLAYDVSADLRLTRYFALTDQNLDEYGLQAGVSADLDRWQLRARASTARSAERHGESGTPLARVTPSFYRQTFARVSAARTFGPASLALSAGWQQLRYADLVAPDGTRLSQQFRDSDEVSLRAEADYGTTSTARFGVYADYSHSDADMPTSRSSDAVAIGAVAAVDVGLARVEARGAYQRRDFTGSQFEDFDGFVFEGDASWYVTPLVTLGLHGSRGLQNSGVPEVGAIVTTAWKATLDWELLRNLVVRAEASHRAEDYGEVDASAHGSSEKLGAEWRLNRSVSIEAYGRHLCRRSTVLLSVRDYCADVASLTVIVNP